MDLAQGLFGDKGGTFLEITDAACGEQSNERSSHGWRKVGRIDIYQVENAMVDR